MVSISHRLTLSSAIDDRRRSVTDHVCEIRNFGNRFADCQFKGDVRQKKNEGQNESCLYSLHCNGEGGKRQNSEKQLETDTQRDNKAYNGHDNDTRHNAAERYSSDLSHLTCHYQNDVPEKELRQTHDVARDAEYLLLSVVGVAAVLVAAYCPPDAQLVFQFPRLSIGEEVDID